MYNKINITENHIRILNLFTQGFDKQYYIRQVQKLLKISPRTSQLLLDDLESKTVLESETKGKIKLYKIKCNEITKRYLELTENFKTIAFFEKNEIIHEIISKLIPFIEGIGIIFGSYVKTRQTKDSDLDIFIVGKFNKKKFKEISKKYGIDISVKNYPLNIFKKNIKNDFLIKEVLDNHIIFLNTMQVIDMVVE